MLDCGMHMGFQDERRFPYFKYVTGESGTLTEHIDCVIISHFHLDHCGALPYMSELVGYNGPIYMTHPTKAICPILLEDYRKIQVERKGDMNFFTAQNIKDCMKKVVTVNLHETVQVDEDLEIKAYYAGHVLGAAMFYMKVGSDSVLYTGDYNMTPDRHLGAAWVDKCRPSLLITESTYATTIRDSKRCRERDFLKKVHQTIEAGGKVLIPVFALGRAQELCILLESYWERMNLKVPIYFSTGLTTKATEYYKLFITWTNQKIKNTFVQRNMFDFKHISRFDRSFIDNPGPMVVFATPGMLHGGLSLEIFKRWCTKEKNMIIMPGYCVAGTVGNKILSGMKKIDISPNMTVEIKMQIEYMSFSAHADAKGIMQLIRMCDPANVMLVHGEDVKMSFLKFKINTELELPCYKPANGETVIINTVPPISVDVSTKLLKRHRNLHGLLGADPKKGRTVHGALLIKDNRYTIVDEDDALSEMKMKKHQIHFKMNIQITAGPTSQALMLMMSRLHVYLKRKLRAQKVELNNEQININSIRIRPETNIASLPSSPPPSSLPRGYTIVVTSLLNDEDLYNYVISVLKLRSYEQNKPRNDEEATTETAAKVITP